MPRSLYKKISNQDAFEKSVKKIAYLSHVADHISEDLNESKKFIGDRWNPMLKLVPAGKLSKRVVVHTHIVVSERKKSKQIDGSKFLYYKRY